MQFFSLLKRKKSSSPYLRIPGRKPMKPVGTELTTLFGDVDSIWDDDGYSKYLDTIRGTDKPFPVFKEV